MNSMLSYSSAYNSRSTDTFKTMTGMSHDDVFAPTSMNSSMTTNSNRIALHYLPQITQALPDERSEYRHRLAAAIKDAKEQHVTDFLRYSDLLSNQFTTRFVIFVQ